MDRNDGLAQASLKLFCLRLNCKVVKVSNRVNGIVIKPDDFFGGTGEISILLKSTVKVWLTAMVIISGLPTSSR